MQKTSRFLKINGKDFPLPARDGMKVEIVTFVNSGRNALAQVVSEVIGRSQYKLSLKWSILDAQTWSEMLQEFDKFHLQVEFFDMQSNTFRSLRMYPGDRNAIPFKLDEYDRITHYKDCTCNLIDMGY